MVKGVMTQDEFDEARNSISPRDKVLRALAEELDALKDEERLYLFGLFCKTCGSKDPFCKCSRDE
jgi:hypothetical protein